MSQQNGIFNIFLYFSALTANLPAVNLGIVYTWTSPAIPIMTGQIDGKDSPLSYNITSTEESLLASLVPLGAVISIFISGYLSDRIGRKNTLLIFHVVSIVGVACLYMGTDITLLYTGRFLSGSSCGTALTVVPIYIGEIAEASNRGKLGCIFGFSMSIGGLFIFILGPHLSLKTLTLACASVPLLFLIVFGIFVPESPYYYVAKGRKDLAEKALLKFRYNSKELVNKELPIIIKNVEESYASKTSIKSIFSDKILMKTFSISIGLSCFQQWSGINLLFFYLQPIFEEANSRISAENCVLIAAFLELLATIVAVLTIDHFGKRILLMTSITGNTLTLLVTGIYFCLRDNAHLYVDHISWVPVTMVILFIISHSLGLGPVPYTMMAELFPPRMRSVAATVNIFVNLLCVFCVTNIFPYFKEMLGMGVPFCFLGLISCGALVFAYLMVPETKGKRLEEIQDLLQLRYKRNK